jgi:hypothetical protein
MIAPEALSISRQCTLLGLARSSFYYRHRPEAAEELELLKRLDRIFTDRPVYGAPPEAHSNAKSSPASTRGAGRHGAPAPYTDAIAQQQRH